MKTSSRGIEDLVHSEGLRLKAYRDSVGVWTIGVGHAATSGAPPIPKAGMTITRQEALDILARDLARYEKDVNAVLPNVPQHVFDGAVSFHFNTGGIKKASWVGKYKAGDMAGARAAFMSWRKPPEIIGRRTREADLIFKGKYYSKGPVTPTAPSAPPPVPISDKETMKRVQQQLINLGYPEVGGVDGIMGTKTRGAIAAFRIDNDMPVSDAIDDAFLSALASAPHRKIAPERADATAADLRTKGSSIISASDVQVVAGGAAGVGTVAAGAIDAVGALSDAGDTVTQITDGLTPFQSLLAFFASYWWIAALIIIGVLVWQAIRIRRARVADHRSGNTGVVGMDRKGA